MRKEDVMATKTLTYMDNIKVKEVIKPSELTVIAARPAMGKTTFALKILQEAAANDNASAIYFTLNEKRGSVRQKLLSMQPDFNFENIFIENAASSVVEICDRSRQVSDEHGPNLVIIDYLQLLGGTGKAASRKEEVAEIVRMLKNLAKEQGCAVILISELSRSPEEREDKRPRLSDFGESSVIADEADTVIFLYRDDYYHKKSEMHNADMLTMADTIKLMLSDDKVDVILADYLQALIKLDALRNTIDMMCDEDELYKEIDEEIENLKEYRDIVLRKLIILDVDIDEKVNELKNPYNDLYRY